MGPEKTLDLPWPAATREQLPWSGGEPTSQARLPVPDGVVLHGKYWATVAAQIAAAPAPRLGAATARLERVANEIVRFDEATAVRRRPWLGALHQVEARSSARLALVISEPLHYWEAKVRNKGSAGGRAVTGVERAAERALELAAAGDSLTAARVLELHGLAQFGGRPGWRSEQHWVDDPVWQDAQAAYFPTPPERVAAAIDDLVAFASRQDVPALLHSALLHAQFLTVRPFADGNGRVARLVAQAHLRARGLTRHAVLPLSAALLGVRAEMPGAVAEYRAGRAGPAVTLFVEAAARAVEHARSVQGTMDALADRLEARIEHAERGSTVRRLLQLVLDRPLFQARETAASLGTTRPTIYAAARALEAAGIIEPLDDSVRRGRAWVAPEVVEALRA